MTDNERIKKALQLNQEAAKINRYYEDWSGSYDQDVADENYQGPHTAAQIASTLYYNESGKRTAEARVAARVLDAGCGTGLVGVALARNGFQKLIGIDLSPNMIEQAKKTGVYRTLCSSIDLTQPISNQISEATGLSLGKCDQFDLTTCIGVFTLGHVPPSVLHDLINVTRRNGLVVVSARQEYCEEHKFESLCHELEATGQVRIEHTQWHDYVSEDRALYVALRMA